jgi:hypothetical protein
MEAIEDLGRRQVEPAPQFRANGMLSSRWQMSVTVPAVYR